jgi:hypothetical protein
VWVVRGGWRVGRVLGALVQLVESELSLLFQRGPEVGKTFGRMLQCKRLELELSCVHH